MPKNLSDLFDEFPPVLCRLLARAPKVAGSGPTSHNMCAISGRKLAVLSDLSRDKIDFISTQLSWDRIKVGDALRFMNACNVDPLNARRQREFIRRANWSHIECSPQRQYLVNLMKGLYEHRNKNATRLQTLS